jgi:hypothetical protein
MGHPPVQLPHIRFLTMTGNESPGGGTIVFTRSTLKIKGYRKAEDRRQS